MMAELCRLPNELFDPIVAHLGAQVDDYVCRKTLASIRFVNPYLRKIVAPYLFSTIPVWLSDASIHRLTEAGQHKTIAKYVKKIVVSPLRIAVGQQAEASSNAQITVLYAQQRQLSKNDALLEELIAPFENLESIEFLTGQNCIGQAEIRSIYGDLPISILSRSFARLFAHTVQSFAGRLQTLHFTYSSNVGALQGHNIRPSGPNMPSNAVLMDDLALEDFFSNIDAHCTFHALSELRIDYVVYTEDSPARNAGIHLGSALKDFLHKTPNLRLLQYGHPDMPEFDFDLFLFDLFDNECEFLPELRHLDITVAVFYADDFMHFFPIHSDKLETVRIKQKKVNDEFSFVKCLVEAIGVSYGQQTWPNLKTFVFVLSYYGN